jgi:hypothetical protein
MILPGLEPGQPRGEHATNCLSYGTALRQAQYVELRKIWGSHSDVYEGIVLWDTAENQATFQGNK